MSTSSIRRAAPATSRGTSSPAGWIALIVGVLVLALLAAWLLGWLRFGTDPRVAEIVALQEQARAKFTANGGPTSLAEASAAFAAFGEIREKTEALPAHLRPQVERSGGSMFRSAFQARIDAYFAAPPGKRQAELDRQIDQEEMLQKARDAFEAARTALGGGRGGQNGQGGQPASGGGPPRGGTEDDRNRWRKNMIDRTTPEERARYSEYRRAMEKRREERGLGTGWGR